MTNIGNSMFKGQLKYVKGQFFENNILAQVSSLIEGLAREEVGWYSVMEGFECTAREFWLFFWWH